MDTSIARSVITEPKPLADPKPGSAGDKKGRFAAPTIPVFRFANDTRIHYTPWLVVRDTAGDAGARPLAAGTVFWESPDVWVVSSLGLNQPVVGQENAVFARVTNYGRQLATGVVVKFWWANPSLAITEANANLIGIGFAQVPSGWSVVVKCPTPWKPILANGGHECLIAEAFIPVFDPLTAPMQPENDRHVGQRNEHVIALPAGASFKTVVQAVNIHDSAQALAFDVQPLHLDAVHPLVAMRNLSIGVALEPARATLPLTLSVAGSATTVPTVTTAPTAPATKLAEKRPLADPIGEPASLTASVSQLTHVERFAPLETRAITIAGQVPADARPGQVFTFQIVQRIGAAVAGGYTVNVVVVKA